MTTPKLTRAYLKKSDKARTKRKQTAYLKKSGSKLEIVHIEAGEVGFFKKSGLALTNYVDVASQSKAGYQEKVVLKPGAYLRKLDLKPQTWQRLEKLFAEVGTVKSVQLQIGKSLKGRKQLVGFVEMGTKKEGTEAIKVLQGKLFRGQKLDLNQAETKSSRGKIVRIRFGGGHGSGDRP